MSEELKANMDNVRPKEMVSDGRISAPPKIAVQDGSVTISIPPATQDDTLDAWFDLAQKARERMAVDEEYRKEVAKGIS